MSGNDPTAVFIIFVTVGLIYMGMAAILRRHFTVKINDIPAITITGERAVLFGFFGLAGALLAFIPPLLAAQGVLPDRSGLARTVLAVLPIAAIALAILGFVLASFFEYLHYLRYRPEPPKTRGKTKAKRGIVIPPEAVDDGAPTYEEQTQEEPIVAHLGDDGELVYDDENAESKSG